MLSGSSVDHGTSSTKSAKTYQTQNVESDWPSNPQQHSAVEPGSATDGRVASVRPTELNAATSDATTASSCKSDPVIRGDSNICGVTNPFRFFRAPWAPLTG